MPHHKTFARLKGSIHCPSVQIDQSIHYSKDPRVLSGQRIFSEAQSDQSKKVGKDQESMQSSTTPWVIWIPYGKVTKTQFNIKNKSQEDSLFPVGDHKAAMNKRKSMTNAIHTKHKCSTKEVPS